MSQTAAPRAIDIIVVTGMSGSGKSSAITALEDQRYYCVDNLPTALAESFIKICQDAGEEMSRVGLGLDLRDESYVKRWPEVRRALEAAGHRVYVVFLDASDDVLLRRFSETRRSHPLGANYDLPEAVRKERELLDAVREAADVIIDTGDYNARELKRRMIETVARTSTPGKRPAVTVRSFGFKYGNATDADLVFDVRFVPNPYFVEALRPLTGLDQECAAYVLERDETQQFLDHVGKLLDFLLPHYAAEGKAYLTLATGCTGGRHRSVAIAEVIGKRLEGQGYSVMIRHRDVERPVS